MAFAVSIRLIFIALIIGLPPALSVKHASACECVREHTLQEKLEMASVVFLGRRTENVRQGERWEEAIEFEVLRVWKGNLAIMHRYVETLPTSCGVNLRREDDFLIFALGADIEESTLYTDFCMGTHSASREPRTLAQLEAGYPSEVPPVALVKRQRPVPLWAIGLAAGGVALAAGLFARSLRRRGAP